MRTTKLATVTAILVACSPLHAQNLIDLTHGDGAGSFEHGSFVDGGGGFMRLGAGSTAITGWTVGGPDGVDWLSEPGLNGQTGALSLDLAALSAGSILTVVPTTVGAQYHLSFGAYGGQKTQTGRVTAGDLDDTFVASGVAEASSATYIDFAFDFTATQPSTTITFQPVSSDGFGPVIDSVSVVPEPATGVLMLLGGLLGLGRLKSKA